MHMTTDMKAAAARLTKADPSLPALVASAATAISIRPGTRFDGVVLSDAPLAPPAGGFVAGTDYAVRARGGAAEIAALATLPDDEAVIGGFHFAPGGNAPARKGGDETPAINPASLWDLAFRPSCPDPRGMALVDARAISAAAFAPRLFWADIYLLGVDHLANGTSRFGVTIADGWDPPIRPDGGTFDGLDYGTARAVMAHHGKALMSLEDFFLAAYGVTERTSCRKEPEATGLDAPRTSRWGLMQATGNMWIWGHDGDPDEPAAALFGGSWASGASSGSRASDWSVAPSGSLYNIGARGRCDPLNLV